MNETHHWLGDGKRGMPFANISGNGNAVWISMRDLETDTLAKAYIPAQQALEFAEAIIARAIEYGATPTSKEQS